MHWNVDDYTQAARNYCHIRELDPHEWLTRDGMAVMRWRAVAYELMDLDIRMHLLFEMQK